MMTYTSDRHSLTYYRPVLTTTNMACMIFVDGVTVILLQISHGNGDRLVISKANFPSWTKVVRIITGWRLRAMKKSSLHTHARTHINIYRGYPAKRAISFTHGMAGRALLAGYPRYILNHTYVFRSLHTRYTYSFILWHFNDKYTLFPWNLLIHSIILKTLSQLLNQIYERPWLLAVNWVW